MHAWLQDEQRHRQVPLKALHLLGRGSSVFYRSWRQESLYGPASHKGGETQPPVRVAGPLRHRPGLVSLQAVVLCLCQHEPLQLRIYGSKRRRAGLINQSAQPKIAPGSCWELRILSPPVCSEQGGDFIHPGRVPALRRNSRGLLRRPHV